LYTAQKGLDRPIAIRYPRGNARYPAQYHPFALMDIGRATRLGNQEKQPKIAVLTTGVITAEMEKAIEQCAQPDAFAHYHFPFVKPLDRDALSEISRRFDQIITAEEGCISGGFGASLVPFLIENSRPKSIKHLGVPDRFIPHGTPDQQKASVGLDLNHLIKTLNECV
jgi:1-deoxy-D-xylulose-5-phosphate synthase